MKPTRLEQDIHAQAASLAAVLQTQCGKGRAAALDAASLLRPGRRVLIAGIGASLYASIPFENFLCSHGIDAVVVEAAELLHYRPHAYRDAVVVLVSRSGESVEIARLLSALKGRLPIIGVSNEAEGTLARQADVSVQIGSLPDEAVAIQSYTGTLLTLYLLGSAMVSELDLAQEEIGGLLPALPPFIASQSEELNNWDAFLQAREPVYLLGRGPSCGSAMEGALLFNEVAKAPAIGMAAASFRHGPVEVVDQDFRGLIFTSQGRTCDLNVGLARDIARFGGRIRLIGPTRADAAGLAWCNTPAWPEMLAPLVEIVPVQFATLRLAQLKGVAAGSFRFTPPVTRDETNFAPTKQTSIGVIL